MVGRGSSDDQTVAGISRSGKIADTHYVRYALAHGPNVE